MFPMMSTRPKSAWARSTSASTSARLVTSTRCTTARPTPGLDLVGGRLGARLVDVAADDRRRPPESIRAEAFPMPLATPVSTATCPDRSNRSCTRVTRTLSIAPEKPGRSLRNRPREARPYDPRRSPVRRAHDQSPTMAGAACPGAGDGAGTSTGDGDGAPRARRPLQRRQRARVPRGVRRRGHLVPVAVRPAARPRLPLDGHRARPRRAAGRARGCTPAASSPRPRCSSPGSARCSSPSGCRRPASGNSCATTRACSRASRAP